MNDDLIPPTDEITEPWWAATRVPELVVQHCRECGGRQHYPRALCLACGGQELEFRPVSGRGVIDSYTVVHRAPHPSFEPPYVLARVRLDEGPLLLTNIVGCPPEQVRCDQRVCVTWRPLPDGRHLPVFSPEE